jgi:hypothetical protein
VAAIPNLRAKEMLQSARGFGASAGLMADELRRPEAAELNAPPLAPEAGLWGPEILSQTPKSVVPGGF